MGFVCEFLESVGCLQVYVALTSPWETVFLHIDHIEEGEGVRRLLLIGRVQIESEFESREASVVREWADLSCFTLTERRPLSFQVTQVGFQRFYLFFI